MFPASAIAVHIGDGIEAMFVPPVPQRSHRPRDSPPRPRTAARQPARYCDWK